MTYQVLARKWRPKSFESLVGQEHVVRALTHALDGGRLHHAYLFTGTRGVGKTTLSRIFAKALNCETGVTSKPCGVCRACREIDEGRFVDYVEMDAASNRGVDEMAALLERAVYAPVDARFKVYMIDEVHMLTNHAFNAMLKTLEEPPPHVKFILATTDPQKIPVTVLSRCLQFNLKQMPAGHIVSHLENILKEEQIAFEPQALRLLSRAADGSMRDALSLTDQAIAYSANEVSEDAVRGMLGALDQSYLIRLLDALAASDGALVLDIADEMALRSLSFSTALQDLASLLHRIAWAQFAPASVLDEWPEAADIRRFAQTLTPEHVQLFYQIATVGRSELGLAPDEYAGFTMTLLRMLAFEPSGGPGAGGSASGASGASNVPLGAKPARSAALAGAMAERAVAAAPSAAGARQSVSGDDAARIDAARSVSSGERARDVQPARASTGSDDASSNGAIAEDAFGEASQFKATDGDEARSDATPAPSRPIASSEASQSERSERTVSDEARGAGSASSGGANASSAMSEAPSVEAALANEVPPSVSTPISAAASQAAESVAGDFAQTPVSTSPRGARASGASAALEVLRSAGMKLSSDRGARGASASASTSQAGAASAPKPAASPLAQPAAKPAAKVEVPTPHRSTPAPTAPSTQEAASARAGQPSAQSKPAARVVPPWEDMPTDDYAPASSEDEYFASMDDGFVPAFDASPDDMGGYDTASQAAPKPAPKPAPRIDTTPLPPAVPLAALGVDVEWPALAVDLPLKGVAYQLAFNSELTACDAQSITLAVPVQMYAENAQVAKLKVALAEKLGRAIEVNVVVGAARRTAAALDAAERAKRQHEAEQEIAQDPFVQSLIRDFGASIVQGSIKPLASGSPGASATVR